MSCQKTDVFPTRISNPSAVTQLSRQPNFQAAVTNYEIHAFIIYLDNETIYYKKVEWNNRYQKHFIDTSAYIKTPSFYDEKPWDYAARKLRKDVADNLRKNIDSRTCFKYAINYFLVKSCFTFGQRKVQPGTSHLYQIGAVQMVIYFPTGQYRHRITKKEKIFPEEEQFWYTKRILRANRCYIIPANTIYVLYAITKCYFSIHILNSEAKVPFHCYNPFDEMPPPAVDLIYRRPVPTPLIEEVVVGDDSAEDQVLITLPTGEDVTENMMMPPPPPPPVPVERTVQVVTPDTVQWYQKQFKYKVYNEPKQTIINSSTNGSVLDLTVKKPPENPASPVRAPSPATSPASPQTPSHAPPGPAHAPSPATSSVRAPSPASPQTPSHAPSPAPSLAHAPSPQTPSHAPNPPPGPAHAPSPALQYAAVPPQIPQMYAPMPAPTYTAMAAPVYTASTAPPSQTFVQASSYEAISPAQPSAETVSFEEFFNTLTPIDEQTLKDFFSNNFCY